MNVVYALGAYPAGIASDRLPAHVLLSWGLVVLILADLAIGLVSGLVGVFTGIALWGLHMALTQRLMAKLVADHAPPKLRVFGIRYVQPRGRSGNAHCERPGGSPVQQAWREHDIPRKSWLCRHRLDRAGATFEAVVL